MYLIYGKGKVGTSLVQFITKQMNSVCENIEDSDKNINKKDDSLNEENMQYFSGMQEIILSPGIPPFHPVRKSFPEKCISELNFLGRFLQEKKTSKKVTFIGISGTNGKSTTTHMCYQILSQYLRKNKHYQVHISGNFGTPLSETISEILDSQTKNHIIVTEVSSFMLYNLKHFEFDYGILTNIEKDHLDRHSDVEDYANSKKNLIHGCKKICYCNKKVRKSLDQKLQKKTLSFDTNFDLEGTHFIGEHNKGNLKSAYLLCRQLIIDKQLAKDDPALDQELYEIIKIIEPLAHRMQLYETIDGIKIFDDGICTSAHAQEHALQGLSEKVILICGGYDKGDSYEHLDSLYTEKVAFGICIGNMGARFDELFKKNGIETFVTKDFHQAMQHAFLEAKSRNSDILFSPGCASFDMFKNVYHRIEEFEKEVQILLEKKGKMKD